jgi:hypothetical protein
MTNENIIIGLIIGLIAYICLDIGKGIQKYAIEGFKEENSIKKKNSGIWVAIRKCGANNSFTFLSLYFKRTNNPN